MSYKHVKNPYFTYKGKMTRRAKAKYRKRKFTRRLHYILETIISGNGVLPLDELERLLGYPPAFNKTIPVLTNLDLMRIKEVDGVKYIYVTKQGKNYAVYLFNLHPSAFTDWRERLKKAKIDLDNWVVPYRRGALDVLSSS